MKKLLSKVMVVVLALSMFITLPNGNAAKAATTDSNLQKVIKETQEKTVNKFKENGVQANIDDWNLIALARSGYEVPKEIVNKYYSSAVKIVEDQLKLKEPFNDPSVSMITLEKMVITLSAIGKDPTNVGGHNLVDMIWQRQNFGASGINELIYGLIAVDTKNYKEPTNTVNTRESMIKEMLKLELANGGFNYSKEWGGETPDVDMTGMAVQALSKHYDRPEVKKVIDRCVEILKGNQDDNGGYVSWGSPSVEGADQVILALSNLKIDALKSENGFMKGKNSLVSFILSFYNGNGEFKAGFNNEVNAMTTEQTFYSLVAYNRLLNGKTNLYDMSDVVSEADNEKTVEEINENIAKLPSLDKVSLEEEAIINSILIDYNSLSKEYKDKITGIDKVNTLKEKVDKIRATVDSLNDDIWNKINPSNITVDNKADVLDIISRYEALSEKDRKYVENYDDVLKAKEVIESLEGGNKENDNVDNSASVKTGDENSIAILVASMLVCAGIAVLTRKKTSEVVNK